MTKYICRPWIPAVASMLVLAACSGEKKTDALSQDSTMNRDLQLANQDTAPKPQLADVPATATPSASSPAPRSTSKRSHANTSPTSSGNTVTRTRVREAAVGTIPAGTTLALSSTSRVCTNTNHVGDHVTATVATAAAGSNGAVIPAGATATLEITTLKRSENVNDKIQMGFRVLSVAFGGNTYPLDATVTSAQVDRVKNQPGGKDAQKVGVGAAVGALAGRLLGHSTKSTIIGGVVGAAAGAGAAVATANYEGCVPQGGQISVSLNNAVQVHTS